MRALLKNLEKGTPFIVIQYYAWFSDLMDAKHKIYEMIYVSKSGILVAKEFSKFETKLFIENVSKFKKVKGINEIDGVIYDFCDFKKTYDNILSKHYFELINNKPLGTRIRQ